MVINIRLSSIRTLLGALCVLFVLLLSQTGAFAHANLIHSTPEPNAVLSEPPGQIALEFSEPLEIDLVRAELYNDQGDRVALPAPHLQPGNATRLVVTLPALGPGSYALNWSVVSEDGHPVQDQFIFSVGHETTLHPPSASAHTPSKLPAQGQLIARYVTETLLLFGSGFYLMALRAERHGFPETVQLLGRARRPLWAVLLLGSLAEWWAYSATLPGDGLAGVWQAGNFSLLLQSPFAMMIAVQLLLLFLLLVPNMVRGWYSLVWLALVVNLAFGGHARGIDPAYMALGLRILHLLALAVWLGGLGYLLLAWRWEKREESLPAPPDGDGRSFRRLFLPTVAASSALVAVSGVFMVAVQSGWSVLLQSGSLDNANFWRTLLFSKIALFLVMLLLALVQTRRWRHNEANLSRTLLQWEVIVSLLVVEAAVWMSQLPYPHP